jgi:hypothetical protein
MNPPVNYVLDDDTQELLETVLNWAQTVVDLQQDEDAKDDMQIELEELALRFNIQRSQVDIEETTDADGATTIKIRLADPTNTRPKLTVVSATSPGANVVILDKLKPVTLTTRNLTLVDNPSANDTEFHDLMDESLTTDDTDPTSP